MDRAIGAAARRLRPLRRRCLVALAAEALALAGAVMPDAAFGIPSRGNDPAFRSGGTFANYFASYAAANGDTSDSMAQVFGCAGTLASKPQLCAGLNRHVAQLSTAQQSNPANYYPTAPANYYARFWYRNAINGLQYGFPYDDFAGQSSDISVSSPQYVVVAVGW